MNPIILTSNLGIYLSFHHFFYRVFPTRYKHKSLFTETYKQRFAVCKKNIIYSLSSFNITIAGLLLFKYKINSSYFQSFYPHFLCIQGIVSYLSDSKYIDIYHWSHHYDITFAQYNYFLMWYIAFKHYKLNKIMKIGLLSTFACKQLSSYYSKKNINLYMFYHTLWHTVAPGLSIYVLNYYNPNHL